MSKLTRGNSKFAISGLVVFSILLAVTSAILTSCTSKEKQKSTDVIIWHWMTDREDVFNELAKRYEKQTGIVVKFETFAPSDAYRDKIRAATQGNLLPDVFSPLGDDRELAAYVKAGHIANLTKEMESGWKDRFFEKPLAYSSFFSGNQWDVEPGIYGVPIDVTSMQIYYNKGLFKEAGLDPENPPKTWPEFIEAGRKLRAAGIQPFVSGFGEGWLAGAFVSSYEWNLLGKQGVIDTIRGKLPYTDPRWVRLLGLLGEMREAGMFASGVATMVNKDAERLFATGRAAMAWNGSWGVNVYHSMNPKLNYGIMLPPRLPDAKYPLKIWGGGASSLNVNAESPNKDKAIAFLEWLTDDEQQAFLAQETRNIPANKRCCTALSPVLREFANNLDITQDRLPITEDWKVLSVKFTGMQSIVADYKTPEQVAKEIESEKKRVASAR